MQLTEINKTFYSLNQNQMPPRGNYNEKKKSVVTGKCQIHLLFVSNEKANEMETDIRVN